MSVIKTNISSGYGELLQTFFKANELDISLDTKHQHVELLVNDDSDTPSQITFMSYRHLGFENMLCDYLIKCGVDPSMISFGRYYPPRNMKEVEEGWQEHRKQLGFQ
jgi:hypothetical protein